MKIGIIVHSKTGHTLSVAERLKEKLGAEGHTVSIERIAPVDENERGLEKIKFERLPDISPYEALVFAAPVHAFSVSRPMQAYLGKLPGLNGKKAACFVTKSLPFKWTGGNKAISIMKKGIEAKGGKVVATGIIGWGGRGREKEIAELLEKFSKAF
ncbi:Flavodoxin [Methanocella conradii HZ254]|uniref:Flavodoxin n=1 Tax=Methanocella conradii (strain DSM 24694 / JCM 17849 / CGMCC 1.5162 / HZ254) TaxID=1041930 RepID=H8I7F7_METCZ|nr:flavodoxin domain-containing protein [Methanocella conradii]AFD00823.1 Flavodoxin [Methanocella conradii HZ254]